MKNRLKIWKPLTDIPSELYVEALYDDYEGFRILLKGKEGNSSIIRITFNNPLSYRNTNESYLLKFWHNAPKEILGNTLYLIEQSSYIDFLKKMSQGIYDDWNIGYNRTKVRNVPQR